MLVGLAGLLLRPPPYPSLELSALGLSTMEGLRLGALTPSIIPLPGAWRAGDPGHLGRAGDRGRRGEGDLCGDWGEPCWGEGDLEAWRCSGACCQSLSATSGTVRLEDGTPSSPSPRGGVLLEPEGLTGDGSLCFNSSLTLGLALYMLTRESFSSLLCVHADRLGSSSLSQQLSQN